MVLDLAATLLPTALLVSRADIVELPPKVVIILARPNEIAGTTGPSTLEMIEDNLTRPVTT
jgi:hypothetical protein